MKIKINKRDVVHGAMELIGCMGMHFTPMTYIHIVALGEKYRKKMMKAK